MKKLGYGIEIELCNISRENAARVIQTVVGGRVHYIGTFYQIWACTDREGRTWKVVSDASINDYRYGGAEVVSPILKYEDIETLQEIVRALRKAGAKTNSTSGIHVHVDGRRLSVKAICNVVKIWNRQERIINKALRNEGRGGGRSTGWCRGQNHDGLLARILQKKPKTMDALAKCWYGVEDYSRRICGNKYDNSRYHALNLHNLFYRGPRGTSTPMGSIEFRCFNTSLHAGEVKAYVQFCLAMVAKARDARGASTAKKSYNSETAKYDMRVFLIKLGLNGEEFKTCRSHLMKHLPGNSRTANTCRERGGATRRAANRVALASL